MLLGEGALEGWGAFVNFPSSTSDDLPAGYRN